MNQKKKITREELRNTEKWKFFYKMCKPKNKKGEYIPFAKKTGINGFTEEDYCRYIDKLTTMNINHKNPQASFDKFFSEFRRRK